MLNVPKLNSEEKYNDQGRFLRGGTKSGKLQHATAHFNDSSGSKVANGAFWVFNDGPEGETFGRPDVSLLAVQSGNSTETRSYDFFRPVNMSVVWIMRVK